MATLQCQFFLDENVILCNTPTNPRLEPNGAVDLREWMKLKQTFLVVQKKFYASFDTAIGILQCMLIYPNKERNDVAIALYIFHKQHGPLIIISKPKTRLCSSYAPQNETDTTTLRQQLQKFSDELEGRFYEYANLFFRIYTELIKLEILNNVGETKL